MHFLSTVILKGAVYFFLSAAKFSAKAAAVVVAASTPALPVGAANSRA